LRAHTRPVLTFLVFGAIVIGAFDGRLVRLLVDPASSLARPDRDTPGYPRFLAEVAARTNPDQAIVLIAPEYEYPHFRATYLLAKRRVIPLLDADGRAHPERLREADVVAVWRMPPPPGYDVIWSGHDGALLRRSR
jgi:hypothetical protein